MVKHISTTQIPIQEPAVGNLDFPAACGRVFIAAQPETKSYVS